MNFIALSTAIFSLSAVTLFASTSNLIKPQEFALTNKALAATVNGYGHQVGVVKSMPMLDAQTWVIQAADGRCFDPVNLPDSLKIEYRQVHSEYLTAFAEAGVIGFVALLSMFVAPAVALFRRIAGGDASPAACAALVTAAAFAGFALTDDMFDRQITVIAFFLLNAWLLRAAWEARAGTGAGSVP